MKATIEPSYINGVLRPPASKSMTQRVYAAALLHKGSTTVRFAGVSDDETAALGIVRQLGAEVIHAGDVTEIKSEGIDEELGMLHTYATEIDCGESGLAARLFTPIAALCGKAMTVTGRGSLLQRPMRHVPDALRLLGVTVETQNGCLPLRLDGRLTPVDIGIDGRDSSQLLSGLLFACSFAGGGNTITVRGLKSTPYIDMTMEVLRHFGQDVTNDSYRSFKIGGGNNEEEGKTITVDIEADWSSAAFLVVAGAVGGNVTVKGLNRSSAQADKVILDVLRMAGADMVTEEDSITVRKSRMRAFEFDATHCPDLFPILAILAACCFGESCIDGVHRLFHKESNRVQSITDMLFDFQVPWSVEDDKLYVTGVSRLHGTVIDSYHDHRIAMAAAVGALRANMQVDILHAESVSKSYPDFFKHLAACGVSCSFNDN